MNQGNQNTHNCAPDWNYTYNVSLIFLVFQNDNTHDSFIKILLPSDAITAT